jgi:hypothetical protein
VTPTELITMIRQRTNTVGDTFWSDDEILGYIYDACMQMAKEAYAIERTYTTTTVAGTREYSFPTTAMAIKRLEYDGSKLQKINDREDDQLTGLNANTTSQGKPQYYWTWNRTIYLRPIPDAAMSLKIFSFNEPQVLTTASALEIPTQFQVDTIDYAKKLMAAKERNFQSAQYWGNEWDKRLIKIKQWSRKRLRSDAFANVMDIDSLSESFLGSI